ncbi:cell wall hydrolase [Paenibacillus hunanensis]|uniref:N-acetylmuramoyl-L-alanine amidase n=1 Tax=Paenibacillus hunanensis TaxID=539262 RepID=A0ABU1IVS8_9BACL|nr:cell wall hydrolase [Paenibacillus hunanensis]MDR6243369.1 N-acetylmuramoyl-L-alanine amidase [Paenibacillus hunanensis]
MEFIRRNQWITPLLGVLFIFVMCLPFWMANQHTTHSQSFTKLPAWGAQPAGVVSYAQKDRSSTEGTFMDWNEKHTRNLIQQAKANKATLAKQQQAATAKQQRTQAAQAKANKAAAVTADAAIGNTTPTKLYFTRTKLLSQDNHAQATWTYALSDKERLMLERIVMAEAEGEPYEGKVAVANVVLNRLRSANFPDTIKGVLYQKYQFSPVSNGRFERVTPNADSVKAVREALQGRKEVPDNTYYFVSLSLATDFAIPNSQTVVKKIGHHTFYK